MRLQCGDMQCLEVYFLMGAVRCTRTFNTCTPPRFIKGIRSLESSRAGGLATYRAVTSEQDPPSLWGGPPVHTRSFALSYGALNFNQINPAGANGQNSETEFWCAGGVHVSVCLPFLIGQRMHNT